MLFESQVFVSGVTYRFCFYGIYNTCWLVHKGGIDRGIVVFDGIGGSRI